MKKKNNKVYLDGAANTPLDPQVFKAMKPYITKIYGNSHSIHDFGSAQMQVVEDCRATVNLIMGSENHKVFFTSGATEGNNWVIKTLADHERIYNSMHRNKIVCSAIEHSSVLNACKSLEADGFEVIYVLPQKNGRVNIHDVVKHFDKTVLLCCVMSVNNETGVINNVEIMASYARKMGVRFLSDCTQALGYGSQFIELAKLYPSVDYMTFSGHKIYGPTGTGVLLSRADAPIYPLMYGGSQEEGARGGTHNVAGIVGITESIKLLYKSHHKFHYRMLYSYLMEKIQEINDRYGVKIKVNGSPAIASKNIVNLNLHSIHEFYQAASALNLQGSAVSAGSACDSQIEETEDPRPSHVLVAMGVPMNEIGSCVRLSFTKYTSIKDIDYFIKSLSNLLELYNNK